MEISTASTPIAKAISAPYSSTILVEGSLKAFEPEEGHDQLLCFIDVETTGRSEQNCGITQIAGQFAIRHAAISKFSERPGRPAWTEYLNSFSYDVRPFDDQQIEEEALVVTGKTREEIVAYPHAKLIHGQLTNLMSQHCDKYKRDQKFWFIAYNAMFDYGFMRRFFERCDDKYFGSWFWNPPIDVMQLAAMRLLHNRQKLPNFKLGTLAEHLQVKAEGSLHDAKTDIELTRKIFELCL